MKIVANLDIDRNREQVWEVFDSFENLKLWQPTLLRYEPVSGEPGQVGTVTKLTYDEDGREVVLLETITSREQPNEFSGTYEADGVSTSIRNRFTDLGDGRTRWELETEFEFRGRYRLMGIFLGRIFRKRTEQQMQAFKALVESR